MVSMQEPGCEVLNGDDIVISGISSLTPDCSNLAEFVEKLYNKEVVVKHDNFRWTTLNHPELNPYSGKVPNGENFDAQYFKVNYLLANNMDIAEKTLMEQTFQAIIDSGTSPKEMWGKKVAVFIGTGICEISFTNMKVYTALLGFTHSMFTNRISYYLNLKGPSIAINGSCISSIIALQNAIQAINTGGCESAIVGATKFMTIPMAAIAYQRNVPLSSDGKMRSYDESANGQVLSESTVVMYLQKYKHAKRVYATVCHAKAEYGGLCDGMHGPKFGPYRDLDKLVKFLREFYDEAKVSPSQVEYVEGHGAAIPEADKTELEAIDEIFCKKRSTPILVGSVMSNIGNTEAASGLCGILKLALAYQRGQIAANLNCSNPRRDIAALRDGRIEIVTEHRDFNRTYTALNCFSLTGLNGHVLLKGRKDFKNLSRYNCNLPYLVVASGRQASAVQRILDDVKERTLNPEEIRLFHNIFKMHISSHLSRGYGIYTSKDGKTVTLCNEIQYYDETKKPIWFVYSGMGSQWVGMGVDLMRIPIFAAAIERCHNVLISKGVDLLNIITTADKKVFDYILNTFVAIAAIQIGLTDVLKAIGLVPNNVIGHSVGELGCGYADEGFTAEEMILMAYYRGLASVQTPFILGSMAAVGIGYKQLSKICPADIEIACRNSPNSCTISGPAEKVTEFIATLTERNIFVKEVQCSNIPYHSKYIAGAGPLLLESTKEVIKSPKLRSHKWISTSVPENKWSKSAAAYCSAEYFTNNLLNPVLFEDMLHFVPSNAVLVEIAPHGLLQSILKRSLPTTCQNYSLTSRNSPDSVQHLLKAIGRLYIEGYDIDLSVLYPKIEFPVSVTTRSFSHMVEWVHDEKWRNLHYASPERNYTNIHKQIISLYDEDYSYLAGCNIQGINYYPFAAALISVWDTLSMTLNKIRRSVSVVFKFVTFYNQPHLYEHRTLQVTVSLQRHTGQFEVWYGQKHKNLIAEGFIAIDNQFVMYDEDDMGLMELNNEDIYKLLHERGYQYSDEFRSIHSANMSLTHAKLIWNNNWVTLLDGMLQLDALRHSTANVTQVSHILEISIDVEKHIHFNIKSEVKENEALLNAKYDEVMNNLRCGGITIVNIISKNMLEALIRPILCKKFEYIPISQDDSGNNPRSGEYDTLTNPVSNTSGNITLKCLRLGHLDSMAWVRAPETLKKEKEVLVNVHYAGLNIIDVKKAMGEIDDRKGYGMDFSGVTETGERVMGLTNLNSASSTVCVNPTLLWPVPEYWSLEEAATVPLAYAHAFYCFNIKSSLNPGYAVLIHGGAGALGLAAISIALAYQCEVFTTVSDTSKKRYLMKLFSDLKEDHIGNSRDSSFGNMVLSLRNTGCNIVINCLQEGKYKNISAACCHETGVIIDTAQLTSQEKYDFGLFNLVMCKEYKIIDFSSILTNENYEDIATLQGLVAEGISRGYVRPLTRFTYEARDAARALRLLAASKQRGRVLLKMPPLTPYTAVSPHVARILCNSQYYQIIISDKNHLGAHLAEKLVLNGAKKIYLHSSQANCYLDYKIQPLINHGAEIKISAKDLRNNNAFQEILDECESKIDAIYIISTGRLDEVSKVDMNAKLMNLDLMSRKHCPQLRYFTVISDNMTGQDIILDRSQNGYPSLLIELHGTQQFEVKNPVSTINPLIAWKELFDTIEKVLTSEHLIIKIFAQEMPLQRSLEEMALITGIDVNNAALDALTLEQLGVDSNRAKLLRHVLSNAFNMSVCEATILKMTIAQLKHLKENRVDIKKDIEGFDALFTKTYLDTDAITSALDIVLMRTLPQSTDRRPDEMEKDLSYLCIVPGLEGHYGRFKQLCERLIIPAVVLHPSSDSTDSTIPEIAQRLVDVIIQKIKPKEHFYLLGYELGILTVLEMAQILENLGFVGTVFLLGGTPSDIRKCIDMRLTSIGDWEEALLLHMYYLLIGTESPGLKNKLQNEESWSLKLETLITELRSKVTLPSQFMQNQIEAAHYRLKLLREYTVYKPTKKLQSKVVILKAKLPPNLHREENFNAFSEQEVLAYDIEATLTYALQDLRCTAIINKCLEPDIKEEFLNSNQCETTLVLEDLSLIAD